MKIRERQGPEFESQWAAILCGRTGPVCPVPGAAARRLGSPGRAEEEEEEEEEEFIRIQFNGYYRGTQGARC